MANEERLALIVQKIHNSERFGLFDEGEKCYFEDGTRVSYSDLWQALRAVYPKDDRTSLIELCPATFVGTYVCPFAKYKWRKTGK